MYTCPVCGYNQLRRPPQNFLICPSCGTEFDYSDAGISYERRRQIWQETGAHWHSTITPQPPNWSAKEQLKNLLPTAGFTDTVQVDGTRVTSAQARLSKIQTELFGSMAALARDARLAHA